MEESKRSAILEMANTEGWRHVQEMLESDERFAVGLLTRPKIKPITKENPRPEPEWTIDEHGLGRARGKLEMAQKYLNLVRSATRERVNQE